MQKFIEAYFQKFTLVAGWKIYLSFFLPLVVLFFATPSFQIIPEHWEPILVQSEHPFLYHDYPAHSHASKLAFRFVPALIIRLLHLNVFGIIVWQYLNGIFLFYVVVYVVELKTKNKLIALYSVLLTAFIFTGKVSFINFKDTFDSLIISLILLCFVISNNLTIFLLILFVGFTDERGLICTGFIFIYYLFFFIEYKKKKSVLITIIASWIIYLLIRIGLGYFFSLRTSTVGFDLPTMALNLNFSPLTLWQTFEGGWILIILFFIYIQKKNFYIGLLFFVEILILTLAAFLVFDVSRSLVYLFPILIIAINYLSFFKEKERIQFYLLCSVLISFIYPAYCSAGETNTWLLPLPLKLLFEFFTNS